MLNVYYVRGIKIDRGKRLFYLLWKKRYTQELYFYVKSHYLVSFTHTNVKGLKGNPISAISRLVLNSTRTTHILLFVFSLFPSS